MLANNNNATLASCQCEILAPDCCMLGGIALHVAAFGTLVYTIMARGGKGFAERCFGYDIAFEELAPSREEEEGTTTQVVCLPAQWQW